jgi:hypothetical protein
MWLDIIAFYYIARIDAGNIPVGTLLQILHITILLVQVLNQLQPLSSGLKVPVLQILFTTTKRWFPKLKQMELQTFS